MNELQILSAVKNNGGSIDYVTLLNIGLSDPAHDTLSDRDLIHKLIDAQILSGNPGANSTISFGKEGRLRLQEIQQLQQKSAEEAAQAAKEKRVLRRHNWLVATIGAAIGSILGSLLTLLAQHFLLL